nr:MAG TPA: hypothetical protein [Caudoviricetes sp.]
MYLNLHLEVDYIIYQTYLVSFHFRYPITYAYMF